MSTITISNFAIWHACKHCYLNKSVKTDFTLWKVFTAKNHCYINPVFKYSSCNLRSNEHNWIIHTSVEGHISVWLFDTAYFACSSHGVVELKFNLSKYSKFNRAELHPSVSVSCSTDKYMITWYRDSLCGPRLNIMTAFPRYGDSYVKDKEVGETVLSLTWGSIYW